MTPSDAAYCKDLPVLTAAERGARHSQCRPIIYNDDIAMSVCRTIATDPRPLQAILADNPSYPCANTIGCWRLDYPHFKDRYHEAKKEQAQLLIDDIIAIADDPANCETQILNYSKLRITTRQWLASKLLPKIYNDKFTMDEQQSSAVEMLLNMLADKNK